MKEDVVIVRLHGGLGNQMFQYAAARSLSERLRVPLKVDLRGFLNYQLHEFGLNRFSVELSVASSKELRCYPGWLSWLYVKAPYLPMAKSWYVPKQFNFDKSWDEINSSCYLFGYFQSHLFFDKYRSMLQADFSLKAPLNSANQRYFDLASSCNSVSIHVRRGDYVTDAKTLSIHGVCDISYYQSAIKYIRSEVNDPVFFVFSNDLCWVKDNFDLGDDAVLVEGNHKFPEVDLALMTTCKHHIIANSSFSWWGAWLEEDLNSIVIAPEPWFDDIKINARDVLPNRWKRVAKNAH